MSVVSYPPASQNVSEDVYVAPMSFAQQRLWFLSQLYPDSPAYNVPFGISFKGALEIEHLEAALQSVIQKHETLRTTFREIDGIPRQIIAPSAPLKLAAQDISSLSSAAREERLAQLRAAEASTPFNLQHGPLLRLILLRMAGQEHVLLITLHHIVSDGWSAAIFVRELVEGYRQAHAGSPIDLGELPIQYADYTAWQHDFFQGEELRQPLEHWKKKLAGTPALLELPTEFARPKTQTFSGATEALAIPPDLLRRIGEFCRSERVTPFMFYTAAFTLLLNRYTRQTDILLGSPVANRDRTEVEPLIGFVANTVILRNQVDESASFRDLLQKVRGTTLDAYAHQQLPFDKLVEELQPERNLAHNPIFQVMIGAYERQSTLGQVAGLEVEVLAPNLTTAKFDLSLYIVESPAEAELLVEYNTDLFSRAFVQRVLGHLQAIFTEALRQPDRAVRALPILSGEERHAVQGWNSTERPLPEGITLVQLLEEQAARSPGAVALRFDGESMTFAEMNARANRLASHLRERGAGRDTLVGVGAERSFEMVLALVAILKAGAAYVPIDPSYPSERVQFMLQDAQVPVLLTQSHLIPRFAGFAGELVCLDKFNFKDGAGENLPRINDTADLAYCIYTSGSTGQPKGALNTHTGICNRLLWGQDFCPITEADKVLQKTPFSFDVSVWEFFWPLITGATLVIARPDGHKDPAYLAELMQKEGITTVHFVPSMLQAFLNEPAAPRCKSIRRVICSGEALPYELQERFFELFDARLLNYYGPTEASVEVTYWECQRQHPFGFVPIGRPVANTRMYILNDGMQLQPALIPGELHIGGVGVARGYHNRPELTAEKFVPDPFAPGARLYKTGDLARWLPDGTIQYLGRIDFQVKIRGFRIELEEIESVLRQHPLIREAVVIAREIKGEQQLIGYFVPYPAVQVEIEALRAHLKGRLPDYMVPFYLLELRSIPLSPNGKADRRALPEPELAPIQTEFTAPRNETEEKLAGIWREVLRLDQVGIHDDFFNLGGHSLLATRLVSRIRSSFNAQISLSLFFEKPTVAELAAEIQRSRVPESPEPPEPRAQAKPAGALADLSDEEVERLLRAELTKS